MSDTRPLEVAVVGAGITGLAHAAALRRAGIGVAVYEKANAFGDIGAGIQLAPNAVRLLHRLGLADGLAAVAVRSTAIEMRDGRTGQVRGRVPLDDCENRYGAPYYLLARFDLHALLASLLPDGVVELGKACESVAEHDSAVQCRFADGTAVGADVLVGADGIRSAVRRARVDDQPVYSGFSVYRGLVDASGLPASFTEPRSIVWTGEGRHFVCYPVAGGRLVNFVATLSAEEWGAESWSEPGKAQDVLDAFADWDNVHPLVEAAETVTRWGLHVREDGPAWTTARTALAGDAAHPMLPFTAQGAGQGIEDAVALAGALARHGDDVSVALRTYEQVRRPRAMKVQQLSGDMGRNLHRDASESQQRPDAHPIGDTLDWLFDHDAEAL
ncbi:FAD-dependent monooxygenase [Saccharopolyspora sp. ASAGF58]|uniref:FAD-dependent monooxygenase n=1 Tax=Saccharopolyspora sp. ASAGF58 TaxID=2719023 RepID=UPI00143FBDA1|nr:FAD-dependent monooxygenase [Saccharopolyspora sp. ASAGF58]QIZ37598.1 salicylate 1-monooxygenase [Saccharopolyspora sp. ASAGF58]